MVSWTSYIYMGPNTQTNEDGEGKKKSARVILRSPERGKQPEGVFATLPPALLRLHRNLKQRFDPNGILNRGRLYPDF